MRDKPVKKVQQGQSPLHAQEEKRNLIDRLEAMRGSRESHRQEAGRPATICQEPLLDISSERFSEIEREMVVLQNELRLSKTTNAMLESDLKRMEQKALDTIAENGQLKQKLDQARQNVEVDPDSYACEKEKLLCSLRQSRHDHFMLTQALIDSENEIARLTRTLEKVTQRLIDC